MLRELTRATRARLAAFTILAATCPAVAATFNEDVPTLTGARDLGRSDPSTTINLTVVLGMHDEPVLKQQIDEIYRRGSPTFRHFLTKADLARFAPTPTEVLAVKNELQRHGLTVISEDPSGFSVRVRGTVSMVEAAFQTELHGFTRNGEHFVAHTKNARLTNAAGDFVYAVAGLDRHNVKPAMVTKLVPRTGLPAYKKVLTAGTSLDPSTDLTDISLGKPQTYKFSESGATAVFRGAVYNPTGLAVSFTPQQLQSYYHMPDLYSLGDDGTGQTIALIECFGYDAALTDANTFSTMFKLPQFTKGQYSIVYPTGKPASSSAADLTGWTGEIALDIQVVHSIAPGAKIVVVASNGQDNEDVLSALQYVINYNVSRFISGSFTSDVDVEAGPEEIAAFNSVLELGAAQGYAFQFSTGDHGDGGVGKPQGAAALPAESPYATAVGGTAILNNPGGSGFVPMAWGNYVLDPIVIDITPPPFPIDQFEFGGGGGSSLTIPKPAWQASLPGTKRQTPDVSALADPNTGVVTVATVGGVQSVTAGVGGTSVAAPLFTAIWAVASQYAGHPLGQAAPVIAQLKPGQITDVTPLNPLLQYSLYGRETDASGKVTTYNTNQLYANPGLRQHKLLGTVTEDRFSIVLETLSFGSDESLTNTQGWDNTTGFGEPNGLPFVDAVSK